MANTNQNINAPQYNRNLIILFSVFILIGFVSFLIVVFGKHPEKAWQTYLINFLLWSSIAQGGLLFSAVMHITNAKWGYPLRSLSESFAAFFPLSFILFIFLFIGKDYIFPWLHHDIHGKEGWLNLPFLFSRDFIGLLVLYSIGFVYLYYAMLKNKEQIKPKGRIGSILLKIWSRSQIDETKLKARLSLFSILYIAAFAIVLTLIGTDLVMSMEPHWLSTLFGPYYFIKSFYIGLGSLIILASIQYITRCEDSGLTENQFHDIGKLFFAFCLLWGDFFYCQLVVIWYGNIPEETSYVIQRVMTLPWKYLAWTVFGFGFLFPFLILLNKKIKTKPVLMIIICSVVIVAIWLENLLLVGPAINHSSKSLPLDLWDGLISLGFLGLMVIALAGFFAHFPQSSISETGRTMG